MEEVLDSMQSNSEWSDDHGGALEIFTELVEAVEAETIDADVMEVR